MSDLHPHIWKEQEYDPNEYGQVVWQDDQAQVRWDGRIWSVWKGKELCLTDPDMMRAAKRVLAILTFPL